VTSRPPEPDPNDLTREGVRDYLRSTPVVTLWPFTGKTLDLSRPTTYRAANSGAIRVLTMGRAKRVASAWLEAQLFGETREEDQP
jgi:hypothetical protein